MRSIKMSLLIIFSAMVAVGAARSPQSQQSPLSDTRLTVHTLLREDIFSGFLADDMERFARGEKNIQLLLEMRPAQKANLLAWQAGATLYRAVRAYESNHKDEFQDNYKRALDLFAEAGKLNSGNDGVAAVTGGSYLVLGDRLPKEYRAAAWSGAYDNYQKLWKQQASFIDRLPVHMRGELLGGLAQSAERTGRAEEAGQYLDKILAVLPNTPYEPAARQWKNNPNAAAARSGITCLTCHESGRLAARLTALNGK